MYGIVRQVATSAPSQHQQCEKLLGPWGRILYNLAAESPYVLAFAKGRPVIAIE